MPVGPEPMSCCGSRGGRGAGLGSWRWDEASGLRFVGCHPDASTVLPAGRLSSRCVDRLAGRVGRSSNQDGGRRPGRTVEDRGRQSKVPSSGARTLVSGSGTPAPGRTRQRPVVPGNARHGTLGPVLGFPDAVARTRECGAYSSRMTVGMSRQRIAESCRFPQPAVMAVAVEKARYVHRAPTAHRGDTSARPRTNGQHHAQPVGTTST